MSDIIQEIKDETAKAKIIGIMESCHVNEDTAAMLYGNGQDTQARITAYMADVARGARALLVQSNQERMTEAMKLHAEALKRGDVTAAIGLKRIAYGIQTA